MPDSSRLYASEIVVAVLEVAFALGIAAGSEDGDLVVATTATTATSNEGTY